MLDVKNMTEITDVPLEMLHHCMKAVVADLKAAETFADKKEAEKEMYERCRQFFSRFPISSNSGKLLPSMERYISNFELVTYEGSLSGNGTARRAFKAAHNEDWFKGLMRLITVVPRKHLYNGAATAPANMPYNPLVPLFLMPFKKLLDIPYSDWHRDKLDEVLCSRTSLVMFHDKDFRKKVKFEDDEESGDYWKDVYGYSREDWLDYMSKALEGINPVTNDKFKSVHPRTPISREHGSIKNLACQTWVAHPQNRNKYTILDPLNWDNIPEPIIGTAMFKEKKGSEPVEDISADFWAEVDAALKYKDPLQPVAPKSKNTKKPSTSYSSIEELWEE